MRVAAIDCGTNSIRLLVADVTPAADAGPAVVTEVGRRSMIVRLGQGIDATGRIDDAALARTLAALDDYAAVIEAAGCERVGLVATSAARDASNREQFEAGVEQRLGVRPMIITGEHEAALSYAGASAEVARLSDLADPFIVLDIGGGSTEVVRADDDGNVWGQSLDIGAVRLTERFLATDPPTAAERQAATAEVARHLDAALDGPVATIVGVAGTCTTVVAHAVGAQTYDREALHLARVPSSEALAAADDLAARTVEQRMELGFMQPGRADVIGGGVLILSEVLRRTGAAELVLSKTAILEGLARELAGRDADA